MLSLVSACPQGDGYVWSHVPSVGGWVCQVYLWYISGGYTSPEGTPQC